MRFEQTPAPQRETVDLCQLHAVERRLPDSKPRAALRFLVAVPAPLRARFERAERAVDSLSLREVVRALEPDDEGSSASRARWACGGAVSSSMSPVSGCLRGLRG